MRSRRTARSTCLTNGGPSPQESTTTLAYLVYGDTPIQADAGLQATGAVLLFVVLLALSALQVRGLGRRLGDVG